MASRPTQRAKGFTPPYARLEALRRKLEHLPSAEQTSPSKLPRGPPDYPPEQNYPSEPEWNTVTNDEVVEDADPNGDNDDDAEWDIESPIGHHRGAEDVQPGENIRLDRAFMSLLKDLEEQVHKLESAMKARDTYHEQMTQTVRQLQDAIQATAAVGSRPERKTGRTKRPVS